MGTVPSSPEILVDNDKTHCNSSKKRKFNSSIMFSPQTTLFLDNDFEFIPSDLSYSYSKNNDPFKNGYYVMRNLYIKHTKLSKLYHRHNLLQTYEDSVTYPIKIDEDRKWVELDMRYGISKYPASFGMNITDGLMLEINRTRIEFKVLDNNIAIRITDIDLMSDEEKRKVDERFVGNNSKSSLCIRDEKMMENNNQYRDSCYYPVEINDTYTWMTIEMRNQISDYSAIIGMKIINGLTFKINNHDVIISTESDETTEKASLTMHVNDQFAFSFRDFKEQEKIDINEEKKKYGTLSNDLQI